MKEGSSTVVPESPNPSVDLNSRRLQASAALPFYVCQWPDFFATMNACDRDLYQWIEKFPANNRPGYLQGEMQRITNTVSQQQYQQWSSCESGRYASTPEPEPGLRIAVASRLVGGGIVRDEAASSGVVTRLSVPFAPGFVSTTCPPIPFHFLHNVDTLGINYYPQHTTIEFADGYYPTGWSDGVGPWQGAKVRWAASDDGGRLIDMQNFFHREVWLRSPKVFDHWVSFREIGTPPPPESLLARCAPFNPGLLRVMTSVPYDGSAPEGQRGQGWHIFIEYTHVESGQAWVQELWREVPGTHGEAGGVYPVDGLGSYGAEMDNIEFLPEDWQCAEGGDSTWYHRVCVTEFKRLPAAVRVLYNDVEVASGVSSIMPLATTPYVPGATAGIASVAETVTVRTVGATKASFRILGVEPVAGFGVRFTFKVVNELHFAACIVTPFLSGIGDRTSWQDNAMHFYLPVVWVVRNLGAHSESDPISILVPMSIVEPGDWPLRDLHWRVSIAQEAYPAPLNQFADGIYGTQRDSNNNLVSPYPNLGASPPPGFKASGNPEQYAFLLAGYLENGDKVWHSRWDSTVDTNRLLLTMPARKAPGAEVPYVRDPRFGDIDYPTYSDQVPFLGFFEWTAEYRVSTNPEVWEPRSGNSTLGLDLPTAIGRYGRYLTLSVAAGRPMWSPYYQKWIAVFETWPGGSVDQLEAYLVETYLRPQFYPEAMWRNFQYTVIKKPYLTANVMWWFDSNAISDRTGYIHALTLIKEASSADAVDVILMGYW